MAKDEDIVPPMLPREEEAKERKEEAPLATTLKQPSEPPEPLPEEKAPLPPQEISAPEEAPQPEMREPSEDEEAPTPEQESEADIAHEEEEAPRPPEEAAKTDDEPAKASIPLLKQRIERMAKEAEERPATMFTVLGGKRALTLHDLKKVIQQMSAEEYLQRQASSDISHWVKTKLFDDELALKLAEAKDKQAAIDAIDAALKPKTTVPSKPTRQQPLPSPEEATEHFERLQAEHHKRMEELQAAVKSKDPKKLTTKTIRQVITLKDGRTAESLEELFLALELLDEKTYRDIKINKKEDLQAWIKELAEKTAKAASINPIQLQSRIAQDIDAYDKKITERIAEEQRVLEDQGKQLLEKEDELKKEQERLERIKEELEQEEQRLLSVNEAAKEELQEREEKLQAREEANKAFLKEQLLVVEGLEKEQQEREQEYAKREQEINKKQEEARKVQLDLLEKKKATEKEIEQKKAELTSLQTGFDEREAAIKSKEAALQADKESFEAAMKRREDLVQEAVDKILAIDQDINSQRANIERMKEELDNEGFQKYLQSALKQVRTDHITFKDLPKTDLRKKHAPLFMKIDACNNALEAKDLVGAKNAYNDLKAMFERERLTQEEKDILFDAIRELYANLHLAMLDQKRA